MDVAKKTGLWGIVFYALAINLAIRWLATGAASGPKSLPIWGLAAVLFLAPLIMATLDLSSRYPGEGAIYAWTRETQGAFAGFMCGWLYWFSTLPFFVGLLIFIDGLLGRVITTIDGGAALGAWIQEPLGTFVVSTAMIGLIALMNARGTRIGKWVPIAGAAATLLLYVFLLVTSMILTSGPGSATDFATADYLPSLDANGAILWSTMVFAYGGAEGVALLRNEIKGGVPTLKRALILVGLVLPLAYVLGTAALLTILPQDLASRLGGLPDALQLAAQKLNATPIGAVLLLGLALSLLGSLSGWFGVNARLPFAAGIDKALPAALGYTDPKTGAPVASIWLQTGIVVGLLAFSQAGATVAGAYDFAVAMSVFSYTLPYAFLFIAYWKAQKAGPVADALSGTGFGRFMAVVGLVTALSAIACSMIPSPDATDGLMATIKLGGASAVLIALGAVIYLMGKRKEAA